jgi:type IV secretory pathway component VirB8
MKKYDMPEVYRKLIEKIEAETIGCECTSQESEIIHRDTTFLVYYHFQREYLGTHSSYDEEPTGNAITSLNIESWTAFDANGESVNVTFDKEEIENYFNTPDYSIDHRDER